MLLRPILFLAAIGAAAANAQTSAQTPAQPYSSCDRDAGPQLGKETTSLPPLPPGITLPIAVGHKLRAGVTPVGTTFVTQTTQRIPIAAGQYLPGLEIQATVVRSETGAPGRPATLSVRFEAVRLGSQTQPVTLQALALANFTELDATSTPIAQFADRVNGDESNWTTPQVGGDQVYRADWVGPVCNDSMRKVGEADYHGVYALPNLALGGYQLPFPRAVGIFSTDAKGVYGAADLTFTSTGGVVTFTSPHRRFTIPSGDRMLLETTRP